MAYNIIETSNYDGEPIYLYEFRLNDNYWRYTSAATRQSLLGSIWEPMGIADDGVKQTGETQVDALNISIPTESAVVGLFNGTPPINPLRIMIRRFHWGDTDAAVCYVGEIYQVNMSSPTVSVMTANTLSAAMERNGLRLAWSRACPYAVYDSCCKVNKESMRYDGTISSVGGNAVVIPGVAAFGNDWFTGGYLEWIDPQRGVERRAIETHVNDTLSVFGTISGLAGGLTIKVYPGCSRTSTECDTKFNNLDNYGGIISMPDRSPFDGNPVF